MHYSRTRIKYQERIRPFHTVEEWHCHNRQKYRMTIDRGVSAEKLIEHSERVRDRIKELTLKKKDETEWLFRGRIEDVDFLRVELENARKSIQDELEVLDLLQERIQDEVKCVRENAGEIVEKCIQFREGRVGIDLIKDEVKKELEIEKKKIADAGVQLDEVLEQTKEYKRDLRASMYLLNRDVKGKLDCLVIEMECLNLKESDKELKVYEGDESFDKGNITVEEWTRSSKETMRSAEKKIQVVRLFQVRVNILLGKIINELIEQYNRVNEAFEARINEIKEAKTKLEAQHQEITRQVSDMKQNIADLVEAIREKEGFLALAQTRLEKRSLRPGVELVRDLVESSLVSEILEIKDSVAKLTQLLSEAEKTLKYLLEGQIILEEEINVKMSSIKIDEVDCMTIRQNINYHSF